MSEQTRIHPSTAHRRLIVMLMALVFIVSTEGSGFAELIDRVVGVANEHPITASDLSAYNTMLNPGSEIGTAAVNHLIDRILLIEEANRFAIGQPDDAALDQRVRTIVNELGGRDAVNPLLVRVGWTRNDLERWIAEDLRIEDFLNQRIYFFVIIPPGEIRAYHRNHLDEYQDLSDDQAREIITTRMAKDRGKTKYQNFMDKLRKRANIRNNLSEREEILPNQTH